MKNLLKQLQKLLKDMDYESEIVVHKEYGRPKDMLIINPGANYAVCPRVVIDEDMSLEDALERCKKEIEYAKAMNVPAITKDMILDNVQLCLEEKATENEYLTIDTPFYDIQAYFRVRIDRDHSFRVTKKHLKIFDIDIKALTAVADFNTVENARLTTIEELIGCSKEYRLDNCMFAVLTNIQGAFGGGAILNDTYVEHIKTMMNAEKLIVLPSSVHELILANADKTDQCLDGYIAMVKEINQTVVIQEERLTDNAYTI